MRIPQSYHEVFDILGESGILQPAFAFEFAKIAGFRNFLSHDYEKVESQAVCEQVLSRIDDVDVFLAHIERAVGITPI